MSNINVNELMKMLSTMDKDKLEKGLSQASQLLNSEQADAIIKEIKKEQLDK